jgi:hypothetical protein
VPLTNDDIQKALRIKRTVTAYFDSTNTNKIEAKELMQDFIADGIFNSNNKDGLPIRDFLRHLDEQKQLRLIPQVHFEQKDKNKNWFFIKLSK